MDVGGRHFISSGFLLKALMYIFVGERRFTTIAEAHDYLLSAHELKVSRKQFKEAVEKGTHIGGIHIGTVPPPERVVPLNGVNAVRKAGTPLLRDYHPLTFGIPKFHLA
jgi:hypothetical protein